MPELETTPFTESLLPLVADFDCGDLDYQREVAEWIRGRAPRTVVDAIRSRSKPTLVWLYSEPNGGVVGYGSLCGSNWSSEPQGKRDMPIILIPNLGLKIAFQGYPQDEPREKRYSSQIIDYLIGEARQARENGTFGDRRPLLGLFVHPDNVAAKRLYSRKGFMDFPQWFTDDNTGITYQGMILKLEPSESEVELQTDKEPLVADQNSAGLKLPERTFEDAVSAVINSPPLPEQQAKKDAAKGRRAERRRQKEQSRKK